MGTKVQSESYLPGYHSMRDLDDDSNTCSWSNYYGDKTLTNGQYYNSFFSRTIVDAYPGYDKDVLKRTMLEHEAIFKNQVSELHRLYRIQRELMDEIKKKDLQKNRIPIEPLLSSSLLASQITSEDAHKWHIPSFPLANSLCGRPSVSGVEDSRSPLSSVKGSSSQDSPFPFQNGGNSKDVGVLECRPTKVRRKLFDLKFPAEDYIDTEEAEQFREDTTSSTSSYLPNGNGKIGHASGGKLFREGKTDYRQDASRTGSCSRGKNSLVDLNEPAQIEETNGSVYSHFLGHDPYHGGCELSAKPKHELLGLPRDISINFLYQSDNKPVINGHVPKNGTRGFFSHVLEAGHGESNSKSISQGFQPQKLPLSSQQVQVLYERTHDSPTLLITNQSNTDVLRERIRQNSEISEKNREISNNSNPESTVMYNVPSLNPFASSDLIKPWSHLVSSRDKSFSSLSEKSTTVSAHPFLNSSSSSSKSSVISSREKWQVSSNSRLSPRVGNELSNQNSFSYGSSSGSKEAAIRFPSMSYNYLNCTNDRKGAWEHFTSHGSTKPYNFSNSVDMKSPSGVNLNVALSNSSSDEPVLQQGSQIDGGRNHEDHFRGLSWLRAKPVCKNEVTSVGRDLNVGELSFSQSFPRKSTDKYETGNDFSQKFTQDVKSVSFSNNFETRREISECLNNKKVLGIPIFERHYVSKNESSSTAPYASAPRTSDSEAETKGRIMLPDINLPCDVTLPDINQKFFAENLATEKEATNISSFLHQFDLNSCVDEDEPSFIPSVPSTDMKTIRGIDLEALVVPELEEVIHGEELLEKACESPLQSAQSKDDCMRDELVKIAAEAIVAISSYGQDSKSEDVNYNSPENSMTDPLNWFVETISSFGKDLERKVDALSKGKDGDQNESSLEEIDYFESMILNLEETREEDYMPEPLVPENFIVEETGATSLLKSRTRKGQGRRGRRRDFQRDILPGLSSLSRLEVTEDLQTFGGLMRATGHSWHSGVTRRNSARTGCGRGRRRSVTSSSPALVAATTCMPLTQQLNCIEVGLEDRSLTGWGKTTRRPRRQRCPTGNPPSLVLT